MREEYIIQAYSPTAHQTVREFNLGMGNPSITNRNLAQQIAESFAARLNAKQHLKVSDWIAKIEWQQLGIETLPGYIKK